jgi:hypothetical protein
MKLGELRKSLRADSNARPCHICAWTSTPRRALYVYRGECGEWFDCGEHANLAKVQDHPNGIVRASVPIEDWLRRHGLADGGDLKTPEPADDEAEDFETLRERLATAIALSPRQMRVLEQIGRSSFDLNSYFGARSLVETALQGLLDDGLVQRELRADTYTITDSGRAVLAAERAK